MQRRHLMFTLAATAAAALAGCSAVPSVSSTVTSFGTWPKDRPKGRYAVERLPSQQAQGDKLDAVEAALHAALARSGFERAPSEAQADVIVQFGARITTYDASPWDDPLWWRWGPSYWRGPGWRTRSGLYYPPSWRTIPPAPDREVGLLLRDRVTGRPLYEARATSTGSRADADTFAAMFQAALSDFPAANAEPRTISVLLSPVNAAGR